MGGKRRAGFKEATYTPDQISEFWEEVEVLAAKRFGTDEDGDNRVEVFVVDRNRFERVNYDPVPYEHKCETVEEQREYIDTVMMNFRIASDAMSTCFKLWKMRAEQQDAKTKVLAEREAAIRLREEEAGILAASGSMVEDFMAALNGCAEPVLVEGAHLLVTEATGASAFETSLANRMVQRLISSGRVRLVEGWRIWPAGKDLPGENRRTGKKEKA